MLRAIEMRIYPTEEQAEYIGRLLGCCRLVYNHLVATTHDRYLATRKSAKLADIYTAFKTLKDEKPFVREVHSKVLVQSMNDFNAAYRNFFRAMKRGKCRPKVGKDGKPTGWLDGEPTFHRRGVKDSCRFPKDAFMGIRGNRLSLVKSLRDIHFKCSRRDERYLNRHQDLVRSVTLRRTGRRWGGEAARQSRSRSGRSEKQTSRSLRMTMDFRTILICLVLYTILHDFGVEEDERDYYQATFTVSKRAVARHGAR